jgi:N4-gp56 family major capsid protein
MAGTVTTGTLTYELRTYYEMQLIDRALPRLVHGRWGQKRSIPKNSGQVVDFRKFGVLSAATNALTEGVTPTGTSVSVTNTTATLAEYGSFIRHSDWLDMIAIDDTLSEYSTLLGRHTCRV